MSSIGQGSISIDDSTRIGENAQDTANEVAGNVNDINSDNKLTPSEKLKLKQEYDKDLKLYAIDVSQLQSAGIPTTELNSALSNLTNFVTPLFKEMNRTSTVDRDTLDSVFTAFAMVDKNSSQAFVNMVQQVADDAKKSGSDAKEAGEKAQEAGEEAKASATQAKVDATAAKQKAQEVISTVNNMTISNRNLALGTATAFTLIGNGLANQSVTAYNFAHSISAGTTITLAMDIVSSTSNGTFKLVFPAISNVGGYWEELTQSAPLSTSVQHIVKTYKVSKSQVAINLQLDNADGVVKISNFIISESSKEVNWTPAPEDLATVTDITASINNIHLGVKNADGSTSTFNMNGNTILMDTAQTIINGKTSILDGTIGTAKIANAAINTAQIADGAINNAKIANASIDDAKINSLNGNKLVENSITANKINVDDLIANGINTKTLTSVILNTSTLTTPQLNLGLNGTFTEDFDYTQPTSLFLPKKNKGTLTFNHGVIQSEGRMQTYVNGQWGGMNDSLVFQSGIDNAQWTEVAPGYLKMDLYKQDGTTVAQRTYSDPTGFYYTSMLGNKSYLGNILQTSQVQTPSVLAKYIGPSDGELRLQIGNNGDHYGFQVGSYAGSEAVLSDFIYSSTSSNSSNVRIADSGRLMRTTSASKYKYNIKNPELEKTLGDRLLNVHMATWNDKHAVDMYADQLTTGEDREKISIKEHYGLIAEQMRDAGLEMFIDYGKNHEIEGIQYDRAWVPLLSVIRRLNDKVNEYELRLSKLEGANK
ncbi:Tail fiber protein [Pediococcus pentosaceus]|uniref:Tail fiber protein n=1 Tax=Pediococcus pentosaceus TaxID=1255 RepID=A0A1Y0VNK5_PEDPE|nr:Tail fiber protein [Pediococcus pentosaceus]